MLFYSVHVHTLLVGSVQIDHTLRVVEVVRSCNLLLGLGQKIVLLRAVPDPFG